MIFNSVNREARDGVIWRYSPSASLCWDWTIGVLTHPVPAVIEARPYEARRDDGTFAMRGVNAFQHDAVLVGRRVGDSPERWFLVSCPVIEKHYGPNTTDRIIDLVEGFIGEQERAAG